MYYENYILINIEIPNFEEIKKKYFDNEGNKIVLLNDNYSIQSPFEYFTPVMYEDPEGQFGILATLIIGTIVGAAIGAGFAVGEEIISNGLNPSDWDWRNIGAGALVGAANGLATTLGGVAGLASLGMAVGGYSLSLVGAATIAIGTSGAAYFGAYSIQQIGTNNWDFNDALINGTKGLWKGFISFGMGYLGGKIGVMNGIDKAISNRFYSNVPMTNLRFLTCASQSLIGEGKTKLVYSAITGLIRWFL